MRRSSLSSPSTISHQPSAISHLPSPIDIGTYFCFSEFERIQSVSTSTLGALSRGVLIGSPSKLMEKLRAHHIMKPKVLLCCNRYGSKFIVVSVNFVVFSTILLLIFSFPFFCQDYIGALCSHQVSSTGLTNSSHLAPPN